MPFKVIDYDYLSNFLLQKNQYSEDAQDLIKGLNLTMKCGRLNFWYDNYLRNMIWTNSNTPLCIYGLNMVQRFAIKFMGRHL